MKDFAGKVAVVTGGASGIGRGIAEQCLREGMRLVLADVEEAALERTAEEMRTVGGEVLAVRTDVSKRSDVEALARKALAEYGGVHLLVNNAGVGAGGSPWEATWNDWEWVVGVNLWGVIHGVKVFTPIMLEQNSDGYIVNTSSAAGLAIGGMTAPYAATKHAVVALSESLYLALKQRKARVGVSVLCPGLVRTNIGESERNRPTELKDAPVELSPEMEAGRKVFMGLLKAAMPPEEVAGTVFEAIRQEQFYVVPDRAWMALAELRVEKLLNLENPVSPSAILGRILKPARDSQGVPASLARLVEKWGKTGARA